MENKVSVIFLAGGRGTRMGASIPKQFLQLNQKAVALYSLEVLLSCPYVSEVIVVCDPLYQPLFSSYPVQFALPGERRQDSVYHGFLKVSEAIDWVCVHDSARPFITQEMVQRLFKEGMQYQAATLGMPVKWTVKKSNENQMVECTLNRDEVWEIQTPQLVSLPVMKKGFQIAKEKNLTVTDDVSLAELASANVKLIKGCYSNLKITTPEDLSIASHFLSSFKNEKV